MSLIANNAGVATQLTDGATVDSIAPITSGVGVAITGATSGTDAAAGKVGETTSASGNWSSQTTLSITDIPSATLTLQAGRYILFAQVDGYMGNTTGGGGVEAVITIAKSDNTVIASGGAGIKSSAATVDFPVCGTIVGYVSLSASNTIKLRYTSVIFSGAPTFSASGSTNWYFRAVRIA